MEKDIEKYVRSNFDNANSLVEGFSSEMAAAELRQSIEIFDAIEPQLRNFAYRVQNQNLFSQMKQKHTIKKQSTADVIADIELPEEEEAGDKMEEALLEI